jgi:hypothetical protein
MDAGYYNGPASHANQENTVRTIIRRICSVVFAVWFLARASISAQASPFPPVSFVRDVAPILVANCQACHGPKMAESNYRLDTFDALMRSGDFGTAPITAGDLDESEIYRLITAEDPEERMPNNGGRLRDAEIEIIANWIREGAKFDGQNAAAALREQIPRDIPHAPAPERYPAPLPITAMAFSADGKLLVVGGYHELLLFEPTTGKLTARIANIPQRVFDMAISADGSWLAVAGGSPGVSGEVRLLPWHDGPRTRAEPKVLATHDDVFFAIAFQPDGKRLAMGGTDGTVRVIDVPGAIQQLHINSHADWVSDVCFSPDGKYIATASRDKTSKVFDADKGSLLATHSAHNARVWAVDFMPDGTSVISAGGDQIRIWNIADSKLTGEIAGSDAEIRELAVANETIIAGFANGSIRHFKLGDRTLIRSLAQRPAPVVSVATHPQTNLLATGYLDGTVNIWQMQDGKLLRQFSAAPDAPPAN